MAVKPTAGDSNGTALDVKVTNLTNQLAAVSSTQHKASIAAALDQAQRELVYHYMNVGRLIASAILAAAL